MGIVQTGKPNAHCRGSSRRMCAARSFRERTFHRRDPIAQALSNGNQDVLAELIPQVYDELRRLAAYHLRQERSNHTLQATALVHEAYLRLVDQRHVDWKNRSHFFGVAAHLMRRILLMHARQHHAAKRGGSAQKISLDEAVIFTRERSAELVALDELLIRLAELDPQQARIVELRFLADCRWRRRPTCSASRARPLSATGRWPKLGWRGKWDWLRTGRLLVELSWVQDFV